MINGLLHCINCTFDFEANLNIQNSKDLVFDECTFIGTTANQAMSCVVDNTIDLNAKHIFNDIESLDSSVNHFVRYLKGGTGVVSEIYFTNSNIYTELSLFLYS